MEIKLSEYQYELPADRIASRPLDERSASKLLVYSKGKVEHKRFRNIVPHLPDESWLVFNDTRVIQARLKFRKESGAAIEVFCLEPVDPANYEEAFHSRSALSYLCLVGNARKWKTGPIYLDTVVDGKELRLRAELEQRLDREFVLRFSWDEGPSFGAILEAAGSTPIPPYLNREAEQEDRDRYQTVYSRHDGSVAAPTAGLHFTEEILKELSLAGHESTRLSLHVGAGTFVPVKENNARDHRMHREQVVVSREFIKSWSEKKGPCIAVGTTSTRSLESLYWLGLKLIKDPETDPDQLELKQWENEELDAAKKPETGYESNAAVGNRESGELDQRVGLEDSIASLMSYMDDHDLNELHFATSLMIVPGYRYRVISGLITNFHMPGSTLLMLIAALVGDDWKAVYREALAHDYRFLSYGDSSLLLPG